MKHKKQGDTKLCQIPRDKKTLSERYTYKLFDYIGEFDPGSG
jgi:hypothetical protein